MAVVLFHYTTRYQALYGEGIDISFDFPLGHYGVQLFFVISGFVIYMTLGKRPSSIDFIISRFSRLYPLYWAAVILTFVVISIAGLPQRETTFREALVNLSMLQMFVGVPHVDGVYWTLTLELIYYVIIFCIYKSGLLRRIELISASWLLLLAIGGVVDRFSEFHIPGAIRIFLLLDYAHLFVVGMILYRSWSEGVTTIRNGILLSCVAVDFLTGDYESTLVLVAILAIFIVALRGGLRVLRWKPLVLLGGISYALYLIHQNIGYVVIRALLSVGISHLWAMACAVMISIMLAHVLHFSVEQPAQMRIRNLYRHWKVARMSVGDAQEAVGVSSSKSVA